MHTKNNYLHFFALQQIHTTEYDPAFSTEERASITTALGVNPLFTSDRLDWYSCTEGHCWGVGDTRNEHTPDDPDDNS